MEKEIKITRSSNIDWSVLSTYRLYLMGVATIWIILYHGNEAKMIFPAALDVVNFILEKGRGGVEIFLMLSGLGLYYSFNKSPDVIAFYKKRILRVVIPYFIIATPFWFLQDILIKHSVREFIRNVTLYSFWKDGNTRLWYFALLIPLYILFPFIYKYMFKKESTKENVLRTIVLISIVVGFTYLLRETDPDYYKKIEIALTRVPVFLLGILFGSFAKKKKKILLGEVIFLFMGYSYRMYTYEYGIKGMTVRYWYIALALVVSAICIFFFEIWKKYNFKGGIILELAGKYSLELYIIHIWVRNLMGKLNPQYVFHGIDLNCYGILNYILIIGISCILTVFFVKIEHIVMSFLER